jgi:hypothetical protein
LTSRRRELLPSIATRLRCFGQVSRTQAIGGKQRRVNSVHQQRQPAAAGNAATIGRIAA